MERETIISESQIDRTIYYGNLLLKTVLVAAMVCLTVSTVLLMWQGELDRYMYHQWYSDFIWYSLSGSMWVLVCSTIYLLALAIYGQFARGRKVVSLTEQFIFLLATIFIAGISVVTAFQVSDL